MKTFYNNLWNMIYAMQNRYVSKTNWKLSLQTIPACKFGNSFSENAIWIIFITGSIIS